MKIKRFSKIDQKLFGNVKQANKALKKAWEAAQANVSPKMVGYQKENLIRMRRKLNQEIGGFGGVNQSINWKAQSKSLSTGSNIIKTPELIGKRGLKSFKKSTLADQKKVMKFYDHGLGLGDDFNRIKVAEKVMKLNH